MNNNNNYYCDECNCKLKRQERLQVLDKYGLLPGMWV